MSPVSTDPKAPLSERSPVLSFFRKMVAEMKDGAVDWDQLEATLIQSDLGVDLAMRILDRLQPKALSAATVQVAAGEELLRLWPEAPRRLRPGTDGMQVWLIVGVNGTGKTTTIAKLAHRYQREGRRVFLVAADTFRAAAIDQLRVWADRLDVGIHCGREQGDPAAAAYEGIEAARQAGADLVLIDTAGRLHNKENLMRELEKVKRVAKKKEEAFPQETVLVIDGTSGSNALEQARQFHKALGITGLVVTKLDSSAKGGVVAAIKSELGLDVSFVGKGEGIGDIVPFDPDLYIRQFFLDMSEEELEEPPPGPEPSVSPEPVAQPPEKADEPKQEQESRISETAAPEEPKKKPGMFEDLPNRSPVLRFLRGLKGDK